MDIQTWFNSVPKFTKCYLISVFFITFTFTYKMINPEYLILDFDLSIFKFQLWRLFTNFCFVGKFSFNFLMYNSFSKTENAAIVNKRYGEFIMMIFYIWIFTLIITFFLGHTYFLSSELLFAMIYIDCKRDPDQITSIYGLFVVKSGYVPWVLLGFSLLTGGNIISSLVGIVVGHIYYFFKDLAPINYHWDLLKTPTFLVNYFDRRNPRVANFTTLNNQNTGSANNNSRGEFRNQNNENTNRFNAFGGRGATWGS